MHPQTARSVACLRRKGNWVESRIALCYVASMLALPPELRPKLHRAWLLRLVAHWNEINTKKLRGVLKKPAFQITLASGKLGQWQPAGRCIAMAESHILGAPWHEVIDTLTHEMAHQFVAEVLNAHGETAHGPAFAHACQRLGITAEASAKNRTDPVRRDAIDKVLQKIQKLLALAESQNAHEAETAMAMANRLLLDYNLQATELGQRSDYSFVRVGKACAAVAIESKVISGILRDFFFVDCLWASVYNPLLDRTERQLELMGDTANLEMAAYVHDFLHGAIQRLWGQARLTLGKSDISTRREFMYGVLKGFSAKLKAEKQGQAERGLVWIGDPGLKSYVRQRYPHTSTMSGSGVRLTDAHAAGQQAGAKLTIHRGVTHQGGGGRLLPGK